MKKQTRKNKHTMQTKFWNFLRHTFVPHRHNRYQPHLVRTHGLLAVAAIVVAIQLSYNFIQTGSVLGVKTDIVAVKLLDTTNQERREHGMGQLTLNNKLNRAAALKAEDMLRQQYWAHTGPNGTSPWQWFGDVDYHYKNAGENLAKGFQSSNGVVKAWMDSPEHKANVLGGYKDVGFAVKTGMLEGEKTTLVVALYGSPKTAGTSKETVLASADSQQLGFISRIGVGIQSMTPALLGSIVLLTFASGVAVLTHMYRRRFPLAVQRSWRRHHGLYKAVGMTSLVFVLLALYGGGQI